MALGLTQEELVARSVERLEDGTEKPLAQAFLSQVEVGRIENPTRGKIRALAGALGMSYNDLLVEAGWIDPEPPGPGPSAALLDYVAGAERRDPLLAADLRQLREENTEEVYNRVVGLVDQLLRSGVRAAAEMAARMRAVGEAGEQARDGEPDTAKR
jgi:transcriptional regulator with XRE-family HTH domain